MLINQRQKEAMSRYTNRKMITSYAVHLLFFIISIALLFQKEYGFAKIALFIGSLWMMMLSEVMTKVLCSRMKKFEKALMKEDFHKFILYGVAGMAIASFSKFIEDAPHDNFFLLLWYTSLFFMIVSSTCLMFFQAQVLTPGMTGYAECLEKNKKNKKKVTDE